MLTACGGDVTFWKLKKILVSHRQPYYRYYCYVSRVLRYQKKRRHFVYFSWTSSFVSNFVCFREIIAGFDIDESYNYVEHIISLCHMLITRFCRIMSRTVKPLTPVTELLILPFSCYMFPFKLGSEIWC